MEHRLYLIRHGQTEWSAEGKHTGRTDVPLTPQGEQQATAAGATLRAMRPGTAQATVLSSPRRRARYTAELAGLQVGESSEDLAEWDYGDYEGITTNEIRRTVPGWTVWTHPSPGGETADQVSARADSVLDRVRQALGGSDVILAGHGHFSRVLVARWLGLDAPSGVRFRLDPAGVSVLGHERGVPQIRQLNVLPS